MLIKGERSFIRKEIVIILACIMTIIGLSLFTNEKSYAVSDKTPLGAKEIQLNKWITGVTYPDGDWPKYTKRYYKFKTPNSSGVKYLIYFENTGEISESATVLDNDLEYVYPYNGSITDYSFGDFGPKPGEWEKPRFELKKNSWYYIEVYCLDDETSTYRFIVKTIISKPDKGKLISVKAKKKAIKLSYCKCNYATRYDVAIKRKGGKWKIYNNGANRSKTFKKLKSGKKYYVKVRGIRIYNGKQYSGKWSAKKAVKVK